MPTNNIGFQLPAVVVTIGTSAVQIASGNVARQSITIRADTANTEACYYGPAPVTVATGMEIRPGEIHGFGPGEAPNNVLQAIAATGTQLLRIQEVTI